MIIWKNTCGESWQRTIENGWEVSGKPGAFLFSIPKGPIYPPQERDKRDREIERRLFDVFVKYAGRRG